MLNALIEPIRTRRKQYEARPDDVIDVLRKGTQRANAVAEETLALAKKAMKQDYFSRNCRSAELCWPGRVKRCDLKAVAGSVSVSSRGRLCCRYRKS